MNPRPPRWTADTELAFLLALRLTGSPTGACDTIGRSVPGTYARRRRVPAFAARWDQVMDELQRARGAAAQAAQGSVSIHRIRYDGMTPQRRRAFLHALSETGRFDAAAAHIGISVPAVTKLRQRDAGFAADCGAALARSTAVLEQAALERAVHGVEEPVYHAGKQIGTRRRFSDVMLRHLIARDDRRAGATLTPEQRIEAAKEAARVAGGFFQQHATREETDLAIMKKLDAIEARRAAVAAEEAARALPAPDDADENYDEDAPE